MAFEMDFGGMGNDMGFQEIGVMSDEQFVTLLEDCHRNQPEAAINIANCYANPSSLFEGNFQMAGFGGFYFFTPRHFEPYRRVVVGHGYWEHSRFEYLISTGQTKAIRRSFVFYNVPPQEDEENAPKWLMEELQLLVYGDWQQQEDEDMVLCKIYQSGPL